MTSHDDRALKKALEQVANSEKRSTRNTIIATLIPVLFGLAFLVFTYSQVSQLQGERDKLDAGNRKIEDEIEGKKKELAELQATVDALVPQAGEGQGRLSKNIEGASAAIVEGALAAQATAKVAGGEGETERRRKLAIFQYAKALETEVNLAVVVRSFEKYGFQVVSRPSAEGLEYSATNAIWFGKDVTSDDARLVAMTLMGAGVKLRWIARFNSSDLWGGDYAKRIHIAFYGPVANFEPLTTPAVIEAPDLVMYGNPAHRDFKPWITD